MGDLLPMLDQSPDRPVSPIQLEYWGFGVQEFQPSNTPAVHDRNDFCRPTNSADQPLEYLPPRKHHALPVQPSNASGTCPALKRIVGWSSNSPSSASPELENATTPNTVAASLSAMRRAASADLQGICRSALRAVPRPIEKL